MQKPQRKPVRAGALVDALNHQDQTAKQKLFNVLDAYHKQFVAPLEARIASLETPWWERWITRLWGRS